MKLGTATTPVVVEPARAERIAAPDAAEAPPEERGSLLGEDGGDGDPEDGEREPEESVRGGATNARTCVACGEPAPCAGGRMTGTVAEDDNEAGVGRCGDGTIGPSVGDTAAGKKGAASTTAGTAAAAEEATAPREDRGEGGRSL